MLSNFPFSTFQKVERKRGNTGMHEDRFLLADTNK